jgi:hypothetical protein
MSIIESDYVKGFEGSNASMYVIGMGTQASPSADPYQKVEEISYIHSVFLRRIANDPFAAYDPVFRKVYSWDNNPLPEANSNYNPLMAPGYYIYTKSDLTKAFELIAKKIKLRLVE